MSALLNNYSNRFASNTKLITTRLFAIKYIAERFSWAGQGKLCNKDDEIREKKNGFRVCEWWDEEEKIDLGFVREQS